jgi:hypothetical protein
MTEDMSATAQLRKLEKYVRVLPIMRQLHRLGRQERDSLSDVQDVLLDARKLAHDGDTSDNLTIKVASYERCVEQLEAFRQAMLSASQLDLLDAADVAQLSAMAEQAADTISAQLRDMV